MSTRKIAAAAILAMLISAAFGLEAEGSYLPGQLIIKYSDGLGNPSTPAEQRQRNSAAMTLISQKYNLPGHTYIALHDSSINLIGTPNLPPSYFPVGLFRVLKITFNNANENVDNWASALRNQTPLQGTGIVIDSVGLNTVTNIEYDRIDINPSGGGTGTVTSSSALDMPNDPLFNPHPSAQQSDNFPDGQWSLFNQAPPSPSNLDADIDFIEAWNLSQMNNSPIVAVVDTGVNYNHEDLIGQIWVNPGEDLNGNGIVDASDLNGVDNDSNGKIDDIRGWDFVNNFPPEYPCDTSLDNSNNPKEDCDNLEDNAPMDRHGHGTHVASTIASRTNNGKGVSGVCPSCKIMALKVGYRYRVENGANDIVGATIIEGDVAEAVTYAVDHGAKIINLSLDWDGKHPSMSEYGFYNAVQAAVKAGVIVVAAAGNYYTGGGPQPSNSDAAVHAPGGILEVISVGGTYKNNERFTNAPTDFDSNGTIDAYYHSCYGPTVDISAPGMNILAAKIDSRYTANTDPASPNNTTYRLRTGTSMAAPHVSGIIGLILSMDPAFEPFDPNQVISSDNRTFTQQILEDYLVPTASTFGSLPSVPLPDHPIGPGVVNAFRAIPKSLRQVADDWPKQVDAGSVVAGSPVIADLNGDGALEVLAGTSKGKVHAWTWNTVNEDWPPLAGWPVQTCSGPNCGLDASPAVANLDGSEWPGLYYQEVLQPTTKEVVVYTENALDADGSTGGQIYAWNADGTLISGWPKTTGATCTICTDLKSTSPALVEFMPGDFMGGGKVIMLGLPGGFIFAYAMNGTTYNNPNFISGLVEGPLVVTDLDNPLHRDQAGQLNSTERSYEIIGATKDIPWMPTDTSGGKIYYVRFNGYNESPQIATKVLLADTNPASTNDPDIIASPAAADLDGDTWDEIIASAQGGKLFVWAGDREATDQYPEDPIVGTTGALWQLFSDDWPQQTDSGDELSSSPIVADLDRNGIFEILAATANGKIYAWHASDDNPFDGIQLRVNGWPVSACAGCSIIGTPVVANLDGDTHDTLEILAAATDGKIHAWSNDGSELPWAMNLNGTPSGAPTVADLNGDGRLEIIAASGNNIFAWSYPEGSTTNYKMPWPMPYHDIENSGRYSTPPRFDYSIDPSEGPDGVINSACGTVNLAAYIHDDSAISAYHLWIDDMPFYMHFVEPVYSGWDPMHDREVLMPPSEPWHMQGIYPVPFGSHTYTLHAWNNTAGHQFTERVFRINVQDGTNPVVDQIQPADGATITNTRRPVFNARIADTIGLYDYYIDLDGGLTPETARHEYVTSSPYNVSFMPVSDLFNGPHEYRLWTWDCANNELVVGRNFTVNYTDTLQPVITILEPTQGQSTSNRRKTFTALVEDYANATNGGGLKEAVVTLDGAEVRRVNLQGFSAYVSYTPASNMSCSTHTYNITATDLKNNSSTSLVSFSVYGCSTGCTGCSSGTGCFLPGTLISMADGTTKPIEAVAVGDEVMSFDEENKEITTDTVTQVFIHNDQHDGFFDINDMKVTSEHPLWVKDRGWVKAGEVKVGDILFKDDQTEEPITTIQYTPGKFIVHNLETNPHHTYYAQRKLVHNKERASVSLAQTANVMTTA